MTCIIIEDQPPAQRILKTYIEDLGTLELKGVFTDATSAMSFLQSNKVDLLFLDIHLPKLSGIDFLKASRNQYNVILTTAFPDYALEGYELNVVDYLLKPFSFQRFVQAVSKVTTGSLDESVSQTKTASVSEIFIKSGYDHIKVAIEDIRYIKSDADYTELNVHDKKHISSEPLRYWDDLLDDDQFIRMHKSYVVNITKISKVSGNRVFLISGEELPIGRAYKDEFSNRLLK